MTRFFWCCDFGDLCDILYLKRLVSDRPEDRAENLANHSLVFY